ncbi:MAG TPA: hypothetical protein VGJ59_07715 [Jatrophihabitantaceae bacterium]|jgi:hypothetical protein
MTAIGHDAKFAVSERGIQLSRMRVPWTRPLTSQPDYSPSEAGDE